jgi:hypothetical protein
MGWMLSQLTLMRQPLFEKNLWCCKKAKDSLTSGDGYDKGYQTRRNGYGPGQAAGHHPSGYLSVG